MARRRFLAQRTLHDRIDVAGEQPGIAGKGAGSARSGRQVHGLVLEQRAHLFARPASLERVPAAQHLVGEQAQAMHVDPGAAVFAAQLLRRGVAQGQRHRSGSRARGGAIERACDAEVEQAYAWPGVGLFDHDVGRLEVAVHDELPMRIGEHLADLAQQVHTLPQWHADHGAVDVLSLDQLHDEKTTTVHDATVDQSRNARVRQTREDADLRGEACFAGVIGALAELQRTRLRAIDVGTTHAIHRPHSTLAQHAEDDPPADAGPGLQRRQAAERMHGIRQHHVHRRGVEPGAGGGFEHGEELGTCSRISGEFLGKLRFPRRRRLLAEVLEHVVEPRRIAVQGVDDATLPACRPLGRAMPGAVEPGAKQLSGMRVATR
jgi:hypothetical protein